MTKEQVQALRDAGITEAAIIDRILAEPAQPAEPAQEAEKAPKEPAAQTQTANSAPDNQDAILEAIERLTGAIQAGNMRTGRDAAQEQSVDDIMAAVLLPNK